MREVVLDTETTGLSAEQGDRVIEIGCVELVNHIPSGRVFHTYINPERPVSPGAVEVHGLTNAFLADKPVFATIAEEFLDFIEGAALIIHNAAFDLGFLDAELARLGRPALSEDQVVDTLMIARQRYPTSSNSLDALCRRYNVDNARRDKHGALLDAELLADVYIELIGARQPHLTLVTGTAQRTTIAVRHVTVQARPQPLAARLTKEELSAHQAMVATLGDGALWLEFDDSGERSE